MSITNVIAGVALFVAGAIAAGVYFNWDAILLFLKLKNSGAVSAASDFGSALGNAWKAGSSL